MEEETKEKNPYLNKEIDTLFFNEKGLKTPYEETYEDVFGKPMSTNRSNINLGTYINGISKEEAKTIKPDVYKNGEIVSGPSVDKKEENVESEVMPEPLHKGITMEELFNKVNEGIVNDKIYKRLNVNVTGTGELVIPEDETEKEEVTDIPEVSEVAEEKINPIRLTDSTEQEKVEVNTDVPKAEASVNQTIERENARPVQNINNNPNPNTSYNNNYEVVRTAYDNAERTDNKLYDEEGAPFAVIAISYLIPFIGIILYLTKHNEKERYARNCLLAGLFGVLTYALCGVFYSLYLIKMLS